MGIGDFISGIFGSKNEEHAQGYNVDPNAYQYGGHAGGADQAAGAAAFQGGVNNAAQSSYNNQQNNLYNRGNQGLDQSNAALGMATDARGAQSDALAMARARATGQAPSIAQMQADRAMQQSVAAQQSQAASARGPAGLALAQQGAAGNIAANQQNIAGQSAIAAAQERLAAEQAYAGQAQGIRATDLGQVGAANQTAGTAFGAGAQSGQLGLGAGQLGLGYSQLGNQIQSTQLAAQMNQQAQASSNALGAQGINAGVGGQNASMNQSNAFGALGLVSGGLGGASSLGGGAGGKAVGGHTSGGHPYLVGEQGPELIVPKKDGFVFTAPQTQFLMQTMTPQQRRALGGGVDGYARAGGGPVQGSPGWLDSYMASQGAVAPATTGSVDLPAQQQASAAFGPEADAARQQRIAQYEQDLATRGTNPETGYDGTGYVNGLNIAHGVYGANGAAPALDDSTRAGLKAGGVAVQTPKSEDKPAPKKEEEKGSAMKALAGKASDQLTAMGQKIDTSYHGPTGYAAPVLIPLPGRAFGGPIQAGGDPYGSMALGGGGGGMDVMGSLAKTNAIDTQYMKSPGGLVSFAREEGGPVKAGGVTFVPENGRKAGEGIAGGWSNILKGAGGVVVNGALGAMAQSPAAQALRYVAEPVIAPQVQAVAQHPVASVLAGPGGELAIEAVTKPANAAGRAAAERANAEDAAAAAAAAGVAGARAMGGAVRGKKKPDDEEGCAYAALRGAK